MRCRRCVAFFTGLTTLVLLAGACGSAESGDTSAAAGGTVESGETSTGVSVPLPARVGQRPFTTPEVPHIQVDVTPVPDVDEMLRARAFALPGVENRPTVISLPGGRGLWLDEDLTLARPELILGGREFSHFHTDGSLHAPLPVDRALEAVEAGWAVLHPWVEREEIPDGFVMLYTPQSSEEAEVTLQLLVESYNFVTGREIDPAELSAGNTGLPEE